MTTQTEWKRVPPEFREPMPTGKGGRIEEFFYEDAGVRRRALAYLPAGFGADAQARYPVFYLMHGGGGSEDDFLGGIEGKKPLVPILDHLIAEGRLCPLIVVTPSFYRPVPAGEDPAKKHAGDAASLTGSFWRELNESLIPAVDARYPTQAAREARAFGGFSMGAEATWSVLCYGGQKVRYYLPMCGDFWAVSVKGGKDHTAETCDRLIGGMQASGLAPGDYVVFAATGTNDIACEAMQPMVEELMGRAPWFSDGDRGGNLTWRLSPGWHAEDWCWDYMALALPEFFPGEER